MERKDLELLEALCKVHAPSGREAALNHFIQSYVEEQSHQWKQKPEIYTGGELQDALILKFGSPRTAVFAHMDSVGFTVRYGGDLVRIGSPKPRSGAPLQGVNSRGEEVEARLIGSSKDQLGYESSKDLNPGVSLTYKAHFRTGDEYVQSASLDNRVGVFNALKQAETLENGLLVFSCQEEMGGGSAAFLARYIFEHFGVRQALITDVTWVTEGIFHGNGTVISRRDSGVPRQSYVDKIIELADKGGHNYQIEVEEGGGSDGNVIQKSPYPIDWCFIGPPEDFVHSPDEKVHQADIEATIELYRSLLRAL